MNRLTIRFWNGTRYENIGRVETTKTATELAEYYRSRDLIANAIRADIVDVAPANCLTSDGGVTTRPCRIG